MRQKHPIKPGSMINQCSVCSRLFTGIDAFDRHRTGTYGEPSDPRRCLSEEEMEAKGFKQSKRTGMWHRGVPLQAGGEALAGAPEVSEA
jgi:hypothetical protein